MQQKDLSTFQTNQTKNIIKKNLNLKCLIVGVFFVNKISDRSQT